MKIYVISYGGWDAPDDIEIFNSEKEFVEDYKDWHQNTKDDIRYIIKGKEIVPKVHTEKVITSWKLEDK